MKLRLKYFPVVIAIVVLQACSITKHVPSGEFLLDDVKITVEDSSRVTSAEMVDYLRQTPNHKVLGFVKLQLSAYSLSGRDSTKWYNKWLRRLGQPPVIYSEDLTKASERQLRQALVNKGYMNARVKVDTIRRDDKKKIKVEYHLNPGNPHYIGNVNYEIADSAIKALLMTSPVSSPLKVGDALDRTALNNWRVQITEYLRNKGYYAFLQDYITFYADTAENSRSVDLTMCISAPKVLPADSLTTSHDKYKINRVVFITNSQGTTLATHGIPPGQDTVYYKGVEVIYDKDHYLIPSALEEKCYIRPDSYYSTREVDKTYEALARMDIIKSINIEMVPAATVDGQHYVDAYIFINRNKKQSISFEIEGTNSEGDLGFGLGLNHSYRNLGRRGNVLGTKLRMSYESLGGNLSGLINNRYTEYAAETGITFPKFLFPFLGNNFTRRIKASTELAVSFNYQERPEYTRIIAGMGWKYKWTARGNRERRMLDLIDINYVYLPKSTIDFINQIAPTNPLLRYSYEDHFIMRMGYSFSRTNKRIPQSGRANYTHFQNIVYSLKAAGETAGNLLYAISSLTGQKREDDVYKIFKIQYAQYAKFDFDYSLTRNFTPRQSLAFRVGAGVAVPYGNSRVVPFEKRFYGGGANGVRGWGVRTLGPGRYNSTKSVTDFINQCGDIRFDMNLEYRAKLFWVLEGALFVDAGNIWTIHNYENQPGGMFHFNSFWKEIAMGYGAGLRLDFQYFLLRLDLGVKAYNPAYNQERWPLIHPRWGRDTTFHFSVGYPF